MAPRAPPLGSKLIRSSQIARSRLLHAIVCDHYPKGQGEFGAYEYVHVHSAAMTSTALVGVVHASVSAAPAPPGAARRRTPGAPRACRQSRRRRYCHRASAAAAAAALRRARRRRRDRDARARGHRDRTTAEMPLLPSRTSGRPSSTARTRAIARCWNGPEVKPYQASLVILSSQSGPVRPRRPRRPGRSPRSRSAG